ncbi:MAG: alpha/beta hydrolase family protein [Armatimonadia bacterium]
MPSKRIFTPEQACRARLKAQKPLFPCTAKTPEEWQAWRKNFKRAIVKELGSNPESVPLNPEILERTDMGDYIREKVVFDSTPYLSVPAWVLTPKGLKKGQKVPGILTAHGHGAGKNSPVGLDADDNPCDDYNHAMAVQLCRRGYVTIAPDWQGFGERKDSDQFVRRPSRDGCNVAYMAHGYFGFQYLNLQIWDAKRTLDYLQSRPEVDSSRLGMIGCSFGGTMTTYVSALDERIKACVIVCYLSTIQGAFDQNGNFCGAQYMPALAKYGDIPDVASLIAPRPMLAEIGEQDLCFLVDDAMKAYRKVKACYKAAGVPERCDVDKFPGGHEFSGRKAFDWFDKWLKG